jgi:hypothetical protein
MQPVAKPVRATKAQAAFINDGTVPMLKGKKKMEMCPDCGAPMFGGKCKCGGAMGKGMTKGDGHKVDKKLIVFNTNKGMMSKGDMCKCGSGMSKSMCKCGGMGKGAKTSMRKAMPVAQPTPQNSRVITDPGSGTPPRLSKPMPVPVPNRLSRPMPVPSPTKPAPSKPMPSKPMPMPMGGTPGKSGQYGGINPGGMYGGKAARGSMRKADAGAYDAAFEDEMKNMPAPKPYPKSKKK